ncbi:MAG: hypothetical protein ACREPR_19270 [Brasilonema sp.]
MPILLRVLVPCVRETREVLWGNLRKRRTAKLGAFGYQFSAVYLQ